PILVLDEPTTGLDPIQRRRMKALVRELAQEHTILFSSHILSEVQDVSTRILVIHQGTLRADGTPEALLRQSRGRRLVVTAALPEAELRALLGGLDGVLADAVPPAAARSGPVAEGDRFATVELPVAENADPRDAAFAALRARGAAVRELQLRLPTLEEFFLQVTEGVEAVPAEEHQPA
ncbi:MAG TPA: ABC transporter, partial [Planctomycetota bacterium]|nr:ABC transporter [Planctomycetota bacterium]